MIDKNHFLYKNTDNVYKIARSIELATNHLLRFSIYGRQYDNGNLFSLTNKYLEDFTDYCFDNYYETNSITHSRLKPGINLWKDLALENKDVYQLYEDGRKLFSIDARIDFVYRDPSLKCYHVYEFFSNTNQADRAYRFYSLHKGKLLKFISYFNQKASNLILEGNKRENLIHINNYVCPVVNNKMKRVK